MKINLLICSDSDEPLLNQTARSIDEAKKILDSIEYEYDAMMDHLTGDDNE